MPQTKLTAILWIVCLSCVCLPTYGKSTPKPNFIFVLSDDIAQGDLGCYGQTLIKQCDIAVVRFGDKYKQWNAAFDAGYCAALDKPYITLHDEAIIHPLKEVDGAAMAWAQTPQQVVEILNYVVSQK